MRRQGKRSRHLASDRGSHVLLAALQGPAPNRTRQQRSKARDRSIRKANEAEGRLEVNPTQWWAVAGLVLGLVGTILNAAASDFLIRRTGGWGGGMSEDVMRAARRWSWPGWVCIGAAFICGAVAELIR